MLRQFSNHQLLITVFVGLVMWLWGANLYAQPDTSWTRTYGGTDWEIGYSVAQTTDGGYIITGWTKSYGAGFTDVWLIKTDSLGDTIWTRTYGGIDDDEGHSVAQTTDGGYIITGYTASYGAGGADVWLIKTDSLGDTIWTRTYGGIHWDRGYSVTQTADGCYIITGWTEPTTSGDRYVWLLKIAPNGDTLWTRTYGEGGEEGYSVAQTSDGGYIITGETASYGAGGYDVWLIKTNSDGDTIWTRTYGGTDLDHGWSVAQTTDGGYIITGETRSFGVDLTDVWLIKTDSLGDTLWTRIYGGTGWDKGWSVAQTTDGGYIITGETNSYGAGNSDVWLIKIDADGDPLWTRTYGGTGYDYGRSGAQTTDGGYIITGYTSSYGAGGLDVWLIKTEPEVGIEESVKSKDARFLLDYPNPFTGVAEIGYGLPEDMRVNISIYNCLGQKVATIVDAKKSRGYHTASWDAKKMSAGVYFIKLKVENYTETEKIVLLR